MAKKSLPLQVNWKQFPHAVNQVVLWDDGTITNHEFDEHTGYWVPGEYDTVGTGTVVQVANRWGDGPAPWKIDEEQASWNAFVAAALSGR